MPPPTPASAPKPPATNPISYEQQRCRQCHCVLSRNIRMSSPSGSFSVSARKTDRTDPSTTTTAISIISGIRSPASNPSSKAISGTIRLIVESWYGCNFFQQPIINNEGGCRSEDREECHGKQMLSWSRRHADAPPWPMSPRIRQLTPAEVAIRWRPPNQHHAASASRRPRTMNSETWRPARLYRQSPPNDSCSNLLSRKA